MKIKVGDKVKLVRTEGESLSYKKRLGDIGTITSINNYEGKDYACIKWEIEKDSLPCNPFLKNLQLVQQKQLTLSDIKERWLVTFRNGEEAYVKGFIYSCPDFEIIKDGKVTGEVYDFANWNNDLIHKRDKTLDIVAVHKPHYDTIWTRANEVKKMTVKQVSKALGYDVEIVEEDK